MALEQQAGQGQSHCRMLWDGAWKASKCHPNDDIPWQDKPSLRIPVVDVLPRSQCLAPAWKRGQLPQSLAFQPSSSQLVLCPKAQKGGTAVIS